MDSGNSGSVQSSSGGVDQDEYDSRTQTLAAFFNPTTTTTTATTARFIPTTQLYNHHFNHADLDNRWARTMRSEPNCNPTVGSAFQQRAPEITATGARIDKRIPPARNPKKRSRASRRAPTTVLTTDTNNFRAMVQEFTGIPSPPFSSPSPFVGGRFDLFGAPVGVRSNFSDSNISLPSLPYPLLRPSPQIFQPPPHREEEQTFLSLPFDASTCQLPASSGLCLSNMQTFQSCCLQSAPKIEEFASGQTQLNGLPDLVSSEGLPPPRVNTDQINWADGGDRISENGRSIGRDGGGMVESWLCSTD